MPSPRVQQHRAHPGSRGGPAPAGAPRRGRGRARPPLEAAAAKGAREPLRSATRPRRILVADDECAIRTLCRVNLGLAGMVVLEAVDGAEAVQLAERERPDAILLDVMMPRLDGWQVARELARRETTREIPILFLTARADSDDRCRGHDAGAVGYIVKPFDPVQLAARLESTLERLARGERERLRAELLEDA